jgi:hypothetical protein
MQEESSHASEALARDHEDGKHIYELVPGCERCEAIRPAVERDQARVRYITGGELLSLTKGWLRADPPRSEQDDAQIEERLEREHFEPDDVDPGAWS